MTTNADVAHRAALASVRSLADQAFSRAAGASLVTGNSIRLLKDARENYPAWLDAIARARRSIHFESYIIHDDAIGEQFGEGLIAKARDGVQVRVIYDWMGGFGKTSRRFWRRLRAGGVEVRCYNAPHPASPLGWLSRDHRKMLSVDGAVGFVTGLCVGQAWIGDPARGIAPWRDTGVEVRGPAVLDIERAFAQVWAATGEPLPEGGIAAPNSGAPAGDAALRIVATVPYMGGLFRLDQLIAALARERLWLTDAYYAGTIPYVQALRSAARGGVDVRLLVPGGTDIPLLRPLSRAGYRTLLEAGVRVFEWKGPMLHAKTAVADGRWARVGSTNLNIASWLGNYELDVVAEDRNFASLMETMYLDDLTNSIEVILDSRHRLTAPRPADRTPHTSGSAGRAATGLLRVGNTVGAAITDHRVLEPGEGRIMLMIAMLLLIVAALAVLFPRAFAYPVAAAATWLAGALIYHRYSSAAARRRRGVPRNDDLDDSA
jgi:cardiolipin synthase A/B